MIEEEPVRKNSLQQQIPLSAKLERIGKKQEKMFENIDSLILQSIQTIQQAEKELSAEKSDQKEVLDKLHEKMMEIKPLKNMKEEYNQFYKKLSGLGKNIQELHSQQQPLFKPPSLFDEVDYLTIEESLVDHYLRQQKYQAAEALSPHSSKRRLFEECQQLKTHILNRRFQQPAQWAELSIICRKERLTSYQIKKMKIVSMVRNNQGKEALDYCKTHMTVYTDIKEEQIRRLISYILTESSNLWGRESEEIKYRFKCRYKDFIDMSVSQLASKFEEAYRRVNNLGQENSVTQCFLIGERYRSKFVEQVKFVAPSSETPKALPFSVQVQPQHRFHSQFFCPVSREVYGPKDKNILLKCNHMISGTANEKIMENRSRRKLKCPVCQEDQNTQNNLEVQF